MRSKYGFLILLGFLILFVGVSFAQEAEEIEVLKKMNVAFKLPDNAQIVPQIQQDDVSYQIAFKLKKNSNCEFRCSFFPLSVDNSEDPNYDVTLRFVTFSQGILLNIAKDQENILNVDRFDPVSVQNEFGADDGFTSLVTGDSKFVKGFKYVLVNGLLKKDSGFIYLYILIKDQKKLVKDFYNQDFLDAYHCVYFTDSDSTNIDSQEIL